MTDIRGIIEAATPDPGPSAHPRGPAAPGTRDLEALRDRYVTPPGVDPTTARAHFEARLRMLEALDLDSPDARRHRYRSAAIWRLVALTAHQRAAARRPMTWSSAITLATRLVERLHDLERGRG